MQANLLRDDLRDEGHYGLQLIVQDGLPSVIFKPLDINRLADLMACLNDVCINGCAARLQFLSHGPQFQCAIFSTEDLV